MNDIQVIVNQKPAEISFNFDEIKKSLSEQMDVYKSIEVTEDVLAERKKDIATLRKIAKALDDKRKEVKAAYNLPYEEFDKKVKELIQVVNEPIELINKQVKEFDEKQKAEKKQKSLDYFNQNVGETEIKFEEVFSLSWLNVATSLKSIKSDIDTAIANRNSDIEAIKTTQSEAIEKALTTYRNTHRLADAMKVINDYEAQKKAILEAEERRKREEEERRKREEERRLREEEARKMREEAQRKAEEERKTREAEAAKQVEIERIRQEEHEKARREYEASVATSQQIAADEDEPEEEGFVIPTEPLEEDVTAFDVQESDGFVTEDAEEPFTQEDPGDNKLCVAKILVRGTRTGLFKIEQLMKQLGVNYTLDM